MINADWRSHLDRVRPTVLVLGGYLTSPVLYGPLRRRLLERGAGGVVVANVWTPDWLLCSWRGLGPIATRGGRGLLAASRLSLESRASLGAPILVVGHSAGGIIGRLLLAGEPFEGRRFDAVERVGALATLGSPHVVSTTRPIGGRVGALAASFAERVVPGACFAPRVGYVAVAASSVVGRADGVGRERIAYRLYRDLLGDVEGSSSMEGDGLVPVRSALLPGATPVVLEAIAHGPGAGRPWYGSDVALDTWWPIAVGVWRSALEVRAREARPASSFAGRPSAARI